MTLSEQFGEIISQRAVMSELTEDPSRIHRITLASEDLAVWCDQLCREARSRFALDHEGIELAVGLGQSLLAGRED